MVIFAAIAMIVVVIAGFVLLASTGWAEQDASDAELYAFLAIIGVGAPAIWTALNLALLSTRGQTGGQYVAGLRVARADGARFAARDALAWWFCFNPLLFSWPMAVVTGFPLAAVIALALGAFTVFVFTALMVLCIVMPIAALVSAMLDAHNRALHDRVVGTLVVPA